MDIVLLAGTTRPKKIPKDSESHKEYPRRRPRDCSSSVVAAVKNWYLKSVIRYKTQSLTNLSSVAATAVVILSIHTATRVISSKQSVIVFQFVKAYYRTALDHGCYRLYDKSQHYNDDTSSQFANAWRDDSSKSRSCRCSTVPTY